MASFAELMAVETLDSHTYKVILKEEWSIGSVPHGGAVTSVLLSVARQHFLSTLRSQNQPDCIILHADFVQRTSVGPAVVKVRDIKRGRQTSTVQLTLTQDGRDEVIAMLTHADLARESGLSLPTDWSLRPEPAPAPPSLGELAARGSDGTTWARWVPPRPRFRKANMRMEIYVPDGGAGAARTGRRGVMDQWIRFKNGERFTNLSLGILSDMFPQMVETYADDREAIERAGIPREQLSRHWYPTLTLNLDVKKRLPEEGVEWIFVRIQSKLISNGRKDLEVIIMDEHSNVIALSHHVAMIVSDARNVAKRGQGRKGETSESKL